MVTDIAAGFTPEAFAPIKTAFDAALQGALAGATGGEGGGGGEQYAAVAADIMSQIAAGFGRAVEPVKAALQAAIQAAGAGITGLETVGTEIVSQVASGIGPAAGTLISAVQTLISTAISAATAAVAPAAQVGVVFVTNIAGAVAASTALSGAVQTLVSAAIAAGVAASSAATEIGTMIATHAGSGAASATALSGAVETMVRAAIDAGVAAAAGASAIGAAVSSGAASGVILTAMNDAVATMVSNGIQAGMDAAAAASPSQEAIDKLGKPISEGAAIGVEENAGLMADATTSLVDGALAAGQRAIEAAKALFAKWGLEWGGEMAAGATESMPAVEEAVTGTMTETAEEANAAGCAIPTNVATGLNDCAPTAVDAATTMATDVGDAATTGLTDAAPAVEGAASDLGAGMVEGAETAVTESTDGATQVSKEAGTSLVEGMTEGAAEAAPDLSDTITTAVDDAMSAADAALQMAKELFAQHGMEFGNAIADNAAAQIDAGTESIAGAAVKMAEKIRAEVEDRLAPIRERAAGMTDVGNLLGGRNQWAANLQSRQEMSLDVTLEIGGEPLDRHIRQVSISPLAEAIERVGSRFGDSF
jgi:hypothetical protein